MTNDLVTRIETLERENRNLKRWGGGALALCCFLGLSSMTVAVCKTVWAERFVLKDASMKQRAVFDAYGVEPQLQFLDKQGRKALVFGVDDDGAPYMEVRGKNGPVRSNIHVNPEGKTTASPAGDEVALAR